MIPNFAHQLRRDQPWSCRVIRAGAHPLRLFQRVLPAWQRNSSGLPPRLTGPVPSMTLTVPLPYQHVGKWELEPIVAGSLSCRRKASSSFTAAHQPPCESMQDVIPLQNQKYHTRHFYYENENYYFFGFAFFWIV